MAAANTNPQLQFFRLQGHNHFSLIAPLSQALAKQIVRDKLSITEEFVQSLPRVRDVP